MRSGHALASAAAALAAAVGPAPARAADPAPDPRNAVLVLTAQGLSFARDRPVANVAPPAVEVRVARRLRGWLEADAGLSLIAFPEQVPELRPGVRLHPLAALSDGTAARAPFLRAAAAALLSASGFDAAPAAEAGLHVEHARLIAYLSAGAARWLAGPRLNVELRAGFGVRF